MENNFLKMDLQFFAEGGETSETPEAAEPETSEAETETEGGEESAPAAQTAEQNHVFAEIRRRAEADAQKKYNARQAEIDRQYAERFKGYTNPETGAPILTAADYMEAMAAQERAQAKAQMKEAGIDPDMLDRAIANSPVVRRAEEVERQNQAYQAQQMLDEDMKAIIDFDPTVGSAQDVIAQPNFQDVVLYCQAHPGTRMSDAYKLVNFDRISQARLQAGKQAAINQAKSKDHLTVVAGTNDTDKSRDIPADQIDQWKRWFPNKSAKELKALYNKTGG